MTFFETALAIISLLWIVSELGLNLLKQSKANDRPHDRFSFWVIILTVGVSLFIGIYLGSTQTLGQFGSQLFFLRIVGTILIIGGLGVRWAAILTLKHQFTVNVAIVQNHRVVDGGIYRSIRHPAYAGGMLSFLGLGLALGNWISVFVILFPMSLAFLYRISVEEKVLIDEFGREYLDYSKRTKRLIPKVY